MVTGLIMYVYDSTLAIFHTRHAAEHLLVYIYTFRKYLFSSEICGKNNVSNFFSLMRVTSLKSGFKKKIFWRNTLTLSKFHSLLSVEGWGPAEFQHCAKNWASSYFEWLSWRLEPKFHDPGTFAYKVIPLVLVYDQVAAQ